MKVHLSSTEVEVEVIWCVRFSGFSPVRAVCSLSSAEFEEAKKKYPRLSDVVDSKYVGYSPTAGINVGEDAYFDNEAILKQFERMFQMLSFKAAFKDHEIEIVVNNARTHSAKEYSLNDFGKGIGT